MTLSRFLAPAFSALCLGIATTHTLAQSEEETPEPYRSLPGTLQPKASSFPEVAVTEGNAGPKNFTINLSDSVTTIQGTFHFGVIRFRTPKTPDLDMVWAFTSPVGWDGWYILPVTGKGEGFRNWLNADRSYKEFPLGEGQDLKLQTLEAKRLKPDQEYLLWFLTESPPKSPATLNGRIHFAKAPAEEGKTWDHEAIEKTLKLTDADAVDQASFLKSRGAQALLNQRFFEPKYAEERIESVLSDIRNTTESHGMFVTMRTSIPNCRTSPSLLEIQKTHGEPDIILTTADLKALNTRRDADDDDAESRTHAHACYDYLTFVYDEKDPAKKVIRVETGAYNLASVKADADGLQFTQLPTPVMDLRVFYKDRKEVARVMAWGERDAKILSGSLPEGAFLGRVDSKDCQERIVIKSPEVSEYTWSTADKKVLRSCELKNHAFQGTFKEFYLDGKKRTEATYDLGKLNGSLKQWDPAGKLVRERQFKDGEPVK